MEEEQLEARPAVIAALKDNIHGLELDERCTQIAAFNVALTAWKLAGYQGLPPLHLACSGIAPSATEAEWTGLAFDDDRLRRGMVRLYNLFSDAPMLGSLINPGARGGSLIEAEFNELAPLLNAALLPNASQETKPDNDSFELGVIAQGLAKAAEMLADHFCLVATNVPFVGMKKQDRVLKEYCERVHPKAKADLATCFVERGLEFCQEGGTTTLVTPQNWLFLGTYRDLRREMLIDSQWDFVARLGPRSFQTPMYDFSIVLLSLTKRPPATNHPLMALDVGEYSTPTEKASSASLDPIIRLDQSEQLKNPDERIALTKASSLPLLQEFVTCLTGALNGDSPRFMKQFWEFRERPIEWVFVQSTVDKTIPFGGRDTLLYFDEKHGHLREDATIRRERLHDSDQRGNGVWGKKGLLVHRMGNLPATFYSGDVFDQNGAVIVPAEADLLAAVWSFVTSKTFLEEVRRLDNKVGVTPATLAKVPFDLPHWKRVAEEKFPHGLPQPHSENPSQWLFDGHPKDSEQPLHVAVSRLLGYRWPRQTGSNFPDCPALGSDGLEAFSDHDGVVCLPPVNREQPAANRLRQLLTAALGVFDERSLIASAGLKGSNSKTLEDWLRDEFFEQHAKLFHDRPFIWHLWDGRSDGFHALVNYHKLDHASLQKLTYSYLGNWIQQQAEDSKAEKPGAAARVGAAQALQRKLAAILEGEAPLDIFVRWKSIKDQSQGWNPDLNDGIRQNIRPFLLAGDVGKRGAGLFRVVPLGLKDNDRGTDPIRSREEYPWFWCESEPGTDPVGSEEFVGTRWNSVHLTLAKKRGAKA